MYITNVVARDKSKTMRPLRLKKSLLYFRIYFFVTFTSKDLTVKEVLMCFVFYQYLVRSGRKKKETNKQKTSEVFLSTSLEWLNNALFGKEIAVGLGLGLFRNALS